MADLTCNTKGSKKSKKNVVAKAASSAPMDFVSRVAPLMPQNPHPLSLENRLDHMGNEMRSREARPWYLLDQVDPAPMYRDHPAGCTEDFLDEGDKEVTVVDELAGDGVPTVVYGYQ